MLFIGTRFSNLDRVSVVIADGANHEFMMYHELFGGLFLHHEFELKTD